VIDWFVLLTPLLSLVLLLPFVFVGCAELAGLQEPTERWVSPEEAGAYLSFDRALQVMFDQLPTGVHHVNQRPIVAIIVQWTLRGDASTTNPLSVTLPVQIKGSTAEAITTRDDPFHLHVDSLPFASEVRVIACRCDVKLDQGLETTREVSLPYRWGAMHRFRLRRGTTSHPLPSISEAPFSVVPETVNN